MAVTDSCIVVGFVFGWGDASEPVHEPVVVVPVHPGCCDPFQVADRAQWSGAKRGVDADAFGLVQPDDGFA